MDVPDHMQGPWAAYLLDEGSFAYDNIADASTEGLGTGFMVAIVRRRAMPTTGSGGLRVPIRRAGRGDVIWVVEEELPLAGDCHPIDTAALWLERAKAMAAGLNAAGGQVPA